jgi:hypothetical protein
MSPHGYSFSKSPPPSSSSIRTKLTKIITRSLGGPVALLVCVLLLWIGCRKRKRLKEDALRNKRVVEAQTLEEAERGYIGLTSFTSSSSPEFFDGSLCIKRVQWRNLKLRKMVFR